MKSPTLFAIGIALIVGFSLSFLIPELRPHRGLVATVTTAPATKTEPAAETAKTESPPETVDDEFGDPRPITIAEFNKRLRQNVPPTWNDFLTAKLVGRERDSTRLNDPNSFLGLVTDSSGYRHAQFSQAQGESTWDFCIDYNQCWKGRPVIEYGKSNIWTLYYPNGLRMYLNYMAVEMEDGFTVVRVLAGWLLKVGSDQPAARIAFVAQLDGAPQIDANLIKKFIPDPRIAAK